MSHDVIWLEVFRCLKCIAAQMRDNTEGLIGENYQRCIVDSLKYTGMLVHSDLALCVYVIVWGWYLFIFIYFLRLVFDLQTIKMKVYMSLGVWSGDNIFY
jgi:hypothetical protein